MRGRFFGLVAGVVLIAEAGLLWRPQLLGGLDTPALGPFTPYRLWVAALAAAVGVAVMLASLGRPGRRRSRIRPAGRALGWTVRDAITAPRRTAPGAPAATDPKPGPQVIPEPPPAEVRAPAPSVRSPPQARPATEPALVLPADPEDLAPFPAAPAEVEAVEVVRPFAAAPRPDAADTPATPPAPAQDPIDPRAGFLAMTARGHQLRAAGKLEDALEPYGEALADARRRAAGGVDPWGRRDLATALTNLGDVHDRDGRIEQAIALHEESLGLRRALAAASPEDLAAQRGLSLGLERLADARDARGHRSRARALYRERLALAERLAAQAPRDAALAADLAFTRERLSELEEALAL